MPCLAALKKPSNNSYPDLEKLVFPEFNQFFLSKGNICGKKFHDDPICKFYVKLLRDRQTPGKDLTSSTQVTLDEQLVCYR